MKLFELVCESVHLFDAPPAFSIASFAVLDVLQFSTTNFFVSLPVPKILTFGFFLSFY